ncbi:MAG TPA: winged helix-turn-helix domain-containing protein [Candidatus Dormibacteraeota bacterium]|nr:winged helix-turn-helix domain-containing protein [Candidatus Dormibacteraeota bacterium]
MATSFRFGPWLVEPSLNTVSRNGSSVHLSPKVMGVLVCLAQHAGDTVPKETLLQTVWPDTFVGDDVLKGCVSELRRALEDDARDSRIIQTIPKSGYRLTAPVEWMNGARGTTAERYEPETSPVRPATARSLRAAGLAAIAVVLFFLLLVAFNIGGVQARLRAGGRSPQIRSVAVLPLRSLSSDPAQEYFSDGLTDGLITDLAQVRSLQVISHTSTNQYKDTKKSLPEIARELNVDGIIEGTVQRSGDRVRINAQLIYGPSDRHVWANTYERDMRDVFALERDVTEDIARQVKVRLDGLRQGSSAGPKPVDPKVLEAYLQGNYHFGRYGEGGGQEEQRKAAEYYQQAIDADPTFAPAYDMLASTHMNLLRGSSEDVAIARKAAERATELDPNFSDARATLGILKWQPYLEWRGAEEDLRRAIELNWNNAFARGALCNLLVVLGRTEEGLRECKIAQQLDPNNDNSSLSLFHARDYDGSIAVIRMFLQKDPNNGQLHCYLFGPYFQKKMEKEAFDEMAQCWSLFGLSQAAENMRHAFAISGYRGAARQWAREVEHLQETKQAYLPGNLAEAYTILGDKDRALYWLNQAYEHREMVSVDGGVFFLGSDPMYDPLRSDPRFKDLLRRVGLPQ